MQTKTEIKMEKEISPDRIELRAIYKHPREKIWKAITEPEQIAVWFTEMDIRAEVGTPYRLIHKGEVAVTGTILEVLEPERFCYSWIVTGTTTTTKVSWNLRSLPENNHTELTLIHEGLVAYGDSAPAMMQSFQQGWESCFSGLETHLEQTDKK